MSSKIDLPAHFFASHSDADRWKQLLEAARKADYGQIVASDLRGKRLGAAFHEAVIRNAKLQAYAELLGLEYPGCFETLFSIGKFRKYPVRQAQILGDLWPVVFNLSTLHRDFDYETKRHPVGKSSRSVYDAVTVLAFLHNVFFDLFRNSELIAEGTTPSLSTQAIPHGEWSRPSRFIDIGKSDFIWPDGIWHDVTVRLPHSTQSRQRHVVKKAIKDPRHHGSKSKNEGKRKKATPVSDARIVALKKHGVTSPVRLKAALKKRGHEVFASVIGEDVHGPNVTPRQIDAIRTWFKRVERRHFAT